MRRGGLRQGVVGTRAIAALLVSLTVATAPGCGSRQRGDLLAGLPAPADAPYELSNDDDLDTQRARYDALPPGPERSTLRRRLLDEYARRLSAHLEAGHRHQAYSFFQRMAGLFTASEIASGVARTHLTPRLVAIRKIRRLFAKSGGDHQACAALAVLREIDPARRASYTAELIEIFSYSDTLNVAEYGNGAEHARPIEVLEGISQFFPSRWVVDRLMERYLARQKVIDSRLRRGGADFNLIRAHGAGVLRTAWHMTAVLAKAERLREAPKNVDAVVGIGDDPELRTRLDRALIKPATPAAWLKLAAHFRSEEEDKSDPEAELAILQAAMRAHPKSANLYLAAGRVAFDLERVPLAVKYLESGLALEKNHRRSSERLAALYENQVISLALGARVKAATEALHRFERFHASARRVFDKPLKPDLADAYAAMGQGLVSLGDLDRALRYLEKSVSVRPTYAALEVLGTIDLKRGNNQRALRFFQRALKIPAESNRQQFQKGKLLRLAAQASFAAGATADGKRFVKRASAHWGNLLATFDLEGNLLADLMIETGKLHLLTGQRDTAFVAFEAALGKAGDSEYVIAEIVARLLGVGEFRRALDVYHRGLESFEVSDEIKVYMSLWVLAESRFRGATEPPFAAEFIRGRKGSSWQDVLARFGAGEIPLSAAKAKATTRRRRSELLFYSAVLYENQRNPARARELLDEVASGSMILDFEYDLARRWRDRRAVQPTESEPAADPSP